MKALAILVYSVPVAVAWSIWAALVFWAGVPEWFGEVVKYGAIALTAVALFVTAIVGGMR